MQQHEVDAAADALLAERLRPTVERVRTRMGRGSPNTVAPLLEVWFAGLAPRLGVTPTQEGRPAGAPAAVRQAMDSLWALALQMATEQSMDALVGERTALAREREDLAAARQDAANHVAASAQREALFQESLGQARRQAEERSVDLRDARAQSQQREGELERARASIADLVAQKDAAARDHVKRLERLEADREKAAQRAASTERRLLAEVDRARQDAKAAHRKVVDLQGQLVSHQSESTRLRETMGKAIHDLQLERAQLVERLAISQGVPISARKAVAAKKSSPRKSSRRMPPRAAIRTPSGQKLRPNRG